MNDLHFDDLVSIIMPTFNSIKTVKDSIKSVLEQSYLNWELLITDDCSTDGTYEYILSLDDERIRVFRNKINSGAGASRNISIKNAKGRYIAFLDSDDLWHKDKLYIQISFMKSKNLGLCYSGYQKIGMNGALGKKIQPPEFVNYHQLMKSNVIGCLTAVYDQNIVGKVFMPTIRKRQDMALWLKILETIDYAECAPGILAYYREGHESLSSNKIKILSSQWSFYRKYMKLNLYQAIYYFSFYVTKALMKHKI